MPRYLAVITLYVGEGGKGCRRGDRKKITEEKFVPRMK